MNSGLSRLALTTVAMFVNPSWRARLSDRPVEPALKSKTLQMPVWMVPGKVTLLPSAAFSPATRPSRFARSPNGARVFLPVMRCTSSTQSPTA